MTLTVSDNKFDLPNIYDKAFKDYQQLHHPQYISLAYRDPLNSKTKLNSQVWYENYNYKRSKKEYEDNGSGLLEERKESFIDSKMYGIDIDYTWSVITSHQLTTGISWLHDESIDQIKEREDTGLYK